MNLKEKVIVVTGAGSGMGRELVFELLNAGANVAAVEVNPNTLKETFEMANVDKSRLSQHVLDVTDHEGVKKLPKEVIEVHGKVDGIINNAGIIQPFVHFSELDEQKVQLVMDINLFGVLNLTRSFLPHILKSDHGLIANTSSMGGFLPVPGQGIYGASKAAVKLFTEALYAELLDTNVSVSVIFPGAIATNISSNSGLETPEGSDAPKHKVTTANDAAKIIVEGLKKEKLRIFVGNDAKMMDRLYRLMPKKAINLMAKMIKKMTT